LCDRKGCEFVSHTNGFMLADNSVNDGYLVGGTGPHLTKAGINKVVKNLKLKTRPGVKDTTKPFQNISKQNYRNQQERSAQRPNRNIQGVRFYNNGCVLCNERGHNAAECRHQYRGPVICNTCGIPGHKSKHHDRTSPY
jgi:hypothetical protein